MTKRVDILCGGMAPQGLHAVGATIHMDVQGPGQNVNLRDRGHQLCDGKQCAGRAAAAYIYCADPRLSRGSEKLTEWRRDWRRELHFTIPVRLPELWEALPTPPRSNAR